ncbi:MAG: flavin reductase family protein [Candidatus Marinimicrobia bacterium]|nr:flavin reductase family protein [Candidatus Neomarinimicrobiota bacterium]MDD9887475.1 flavin reductase family protein [Candidatus Neomarinimicrobiota bacterium]
MIFDPNEIPFQETHKLMIGSIVPRPIAFVSTQSKNGKNNVAPFSYFNGVCSKPPTIMFAPARRGWDGEEKDTLINIRDTEEFVVNIVSESFAEKMVMCATDFDSDVDEFEISGLNTADSQKINPPRVEEAKISFECKLNQIVEIGDGSAGSGFVVIGTIVLFHIDDDIYDNGRILLNQLEPLGRIAGNWYTRITDTLKIVRKVKPD